MRLTASPTKNALMPNSSDPQLKDASGPEISLSHRDQSPTTSPRGSFRRVSDCAKKLDQIGEERLGGGWCERLVARAGRASERCRHQRCGPTAEPECASVAAGYTIHLSVVKRRCGPAGAGQERQDCETEK